jgi:hypothetical protein
MQYLALKGGRVLDKTAMQIRTASEQRASAPNPYCQVTETELGTTDREARGTKIFSMTPFPCICLVSLVAYYYHLVRCLASLMQGRRV